ncbi:MAG TPA: phenylacetate-CoA oxygenase/reductase subunit PaaK [Ottowia sp.]|uniref:1,2-phenylacetyl-CoA epoxidase subunit PaaE n=1 Tax=Ottowia sp. TaxID=1898956 RepID=UPI002B5AEDD8|nr:1,2-phenylacetyl-CoA epoxidase subunit PaaE [Ottowia sp.]HMN20060.1 phenylacetate-CoA oxygenase/reductase subunit PaaK [Ottowia sp.]
MASPRFHELTVARISPEAAGAVAITFAVPPELHEVFAFEPGQFLTLRAQLDGEDVRRNYSICSTRRRYRQARELEVGIRPMQGGLFSNWAATRLKAGDRLAVLPPDGRFTMRRPHALHRVGFAAGSGITPILSLVASTLEDSPTAKFTLVYGNRRMASVMFNEALQDLKDKYRDRLTLIHVLSRQAQEVPLLEGRIDAAKVRQLVDTLLPSASMDEVFICGPEAMIDATQAALVEAGVPQDRIRTERFSSPRLDVLDAEARAAALQHADPEAPAGEVALTLTLDGKTHQLAMQRGQRVLDVALAAGLDAPFSCRDGVCCTCRAKVLAGSVTMDKNFSLEPDELAQGFVLTCQARPDTDALSISYDER